MQLKLGEMQDKLIKTMIISGVSDIEMRQKLLQDDPKILEGATEICQIMEKSKERCQIRGKNSNDFLGIGSVKKEDSNLQTNLKFIKNCLK